MVLGDLPPNLKAMVKEDQWAGETPPAFVPLYNADGGEVGVIVVWYDNFLVLSKDKEVVEMWKIHIEGEHKVVTHGGRPLRRSDK